MRFCNDISDLNLWGRHQSYNHVLLAENVLNARLLTSFVITFPETLSSTEMIPKTGGRVIILHIAQHEHETFICVQISLCCSEIQIIQMFVLMWARTIWGTGSLLAGYWYQCLSRNDDESLMIYKKNLRDKIIRVRIWLIKTKEISFSAHYQIIRFFW